MKYFTAAVVLVAVAAISSTQISAQTPPNPTPSPEFQCPDREDGYYPHPTDCASYFYCTNGLAWLMRCADPLFFNLRTKLCDWPFNVDCQQQRLGGAAVRVSPNPAERGVSLIGPAPDYQCDADGAFPHPTDCEYFYDCWKGNATLGICTENQLFDLTYSGCNWPELTQCQDRSRPPGLPTPTPTTTRRPGVTDGPEFQCPKPDGLFEDPQDCTAYYHCGGNVAWHQLCPYPLRFREDIQACDHPGSVDCGTRPIPSKSP